ncbi:hypothetical protein CGC54_06665 [Capnocytophaga canimorsus]|uniref:Uncharacterized protein n=1 Tax=Capnocytophaga canimorsus TaxID=28188 RepID=A0AAC9Z3T2_9FLAO|nr:hypothetical protein [Capnocytophaga canimorsus]ATA94033.1 hypothetical protein CGC54_06665 [Capnocytophaga canimorsus]
MEKRKLEIYTFQIYEKQNSEIIPLLENIYGVDLFTELVNKFPNFVDTFPPDSLQKRTCKIEKVRSEKKNQKKSVFTHTETSRYIAGKICIGEDDEKEQEVVQNNKRKKLLYTKKKGQSIERPYFFMIILPLDKKYGFLILEREGKHSLKTAIETLICRFIKSKFSTLEVKFTNFVEDSLIKEYLSKGNYNSIILSRNFLAKEKSEQYLGEYQNSGEYKVEIKITPMKGIEVPYFTKKRIISQLEKKTGFFIGEEFKNIGFDENTNIKVVSTYNKNTRTIDLEDTFKMRPYYLINVDINEKGFSDFDSITREAIKLIKELTLNII